MIRQSPIPDLSHPQFFPDLLRGAALPFRAFGLILTTPRLFLLGLMSGVVTGVSLISMAIAFWPLSRRFADQLISGDSWWMKGAEVGLSVVFYAVMFIVGALTVPNILLAPLGDPISEATEMACGDFLSPPFTLGGLVRGTAAGLLHTMVRLLVMTLGAAILWPINFVPVVGGVIWVVGSSLWSMFWLSVEHLSAPMARHLYSFPRVVGVLRQRLPLALGFGATLFVVLWIPVLNFFLLPIAIVAGTLLYRGLLRLGVF